MVEQHFSSSLECVQQQAAARLLATQSENLDIPVLMKIQEMNGNPVNSKTMKSPVP
jgi:hypothetical protein